MFAERRRRLRHSWLDDRSQRILGQFFWLYRVSTSAISLAVRSAQAESPSPCAITTWAERPERKRAQRSSFSIQIRIGTRCTTLVNSPDTTFLGKSANWAPVDLLIQTTRPRNGRSKASSHSSTEFPGANPRSRVSSRFAVTYSSSGLYMLKIGVPADT